MSTSKFSGYSEECSSCESGWTNYLVSPVHGDDHHDDGGSDNGEAESVLVDSGDEDRNGGSNNDTDDDSMASDASTGLVNSKRSHAASDNESQEMDQHFKLGDEDDESAQCSSQSDKFYKVEVSNGRKCEPYGKPKDRKKRL